MSSVREGVNICNISLKIQLQLLSLSLAGAHYTASLCRLDIEKLNFASTQKNIAKSGTYVNHIDNRLNPNPGLS